jgi:excisionase family DNA binding protein
MEKRQNEVTVREAAERLNVSRQAIYVWLKPEQGCPHRKVYRGKQAEILLDMSLVNAWLKSERSRK